MEIGLVELGAVGNRLHRGKNSPVRRRLLVLREDRLDDLLDGLVLEDAAVGFQAQAPDAWHRHEAVAHSPGRARTGPLEFRDEPVEMARDRLVLAVIRDRDGDLLRQEVTRLEAGIAAQDVHFDRVGHAEPLGHRQSGRNESALAERRGYSQEAGCIHAGIVLAR